LRRGAVHPTDFQDVLVNHEIALSFVNRAVDVASNAGQRIAVVVVDTGGHIVASARMTGVGYINVDAARRKAAASANFGAPTAMVSDMMGSDPKLAPVLNDPAILVLPGGAPLMDAGMLVGGIGIAGGHYSQDQALLDTLLSS
jgi:glc operon protein GlcG